MYYETCRITFLDVLVMTCCRNLNLVFQFSHLSHPNKRTHIGFFLHFQTFYFFPEMTSGHCPVLNNGLGSFWFSMVQVVHGFIDCLASDSFIVSFSLEI